MGRASYYGHPRQIYPYKCIGLTNQMRRLRFLQVFASSGVTYLQENRYQHTSHPRRLSVSPQRWLRLGRIVLAHYLLRIVDLYLLSSFLPPPTHSMTEYDFTSEAYRLANMHRISKWLNIINLHNRRGATAAPQVQLYTV